MLSLLGNCKLKTLVAARQQEMKHTSMDTLASLVLLCGYCCMATNDRMDSVSTGPARCCIEKTRHNRDQISSVGE
jgi:hypothetical protein